MADCNYGFSMLLITKQAALQADRRLWFLFLRYHNCSGSHRGNSAAAKILAQGSAHTGQR